MNDLYFFLFNRVSDAIDLLRQEDAAAALEVLIQAQIDAEERYISMEDQ